MDELLGNLKHLGIPAELSPRQALNQHLEHAKAKLGAAEEGRLAASVELISVVILFFNGCRLLNSRALLPTSFSREPLH